MSNPKPTWEDVQFELMLEESVPTKKELHRWQRRYPEYRRELARFVAGWASEKPVPDGPVLDPAHEERLVKRGVEFAMKMLEERDLILPPFPIEQLRPFDQIVLNAVHELQGDGYSVNIAERVSRVLGSPVLPGDTFASLSRLESAGLVMARMADPAKCEGKTRRYFAATLAGEGALAHAPAQSAAVADYLGDEA